MTMSASRRILAIAVAMVLGLSMAASAETAMQLLNRASQKIAKAGSVSASFVFSGGGTSGLGTLKISGKRFSVQAPGSASWYNGKYLWTYSAASRETTLVVPTASELAETNPLTCMAGGVSGYNCAYGKGSTATKKIIVLTPKSRKQGIRNATVEINASTLVPAKISVKASDGSVTAVSITKFSYGKSLPASDFEYPKNKYPKIKIIDLR